MLPECLPFSFLVNTVAMLVRQLHEVKPSFLLIDISVSKSKASYNSWQPKTSKLMPYTPPKPFHYMKAAVKCCSTKHEAWQTGNSNHSFDSVSFPGSGYNSVAELTWWSTACWHLEYHPKRLHSASPHWYTCHPFSSNTSARSSVLHKRERKCR